MSETVETKKSGEPVEVVKTGEPGRPEFSESQFNTWLLAIEPFLRKGNSLYFCCGIAGIESHYDVILRKYKLNDWFSKKVDAFRASPGEIVNEAIINVALSAATKIKIQAPVSKDELDMLKFVAEKHRTAQPFFVTRTETATADPSKVGKILDTIEEQTDYEQLANSARREVEGQVVETNPPVQNPQ